MFQGGGLATQLQDLKPAQVMSPAAQSTLAWREWPCPELGTASRFCWSFVCETNHRKSSVSHFWKQSRAEVCSRFIPLACLFWVSCSFESSLENDARCSQTLKRAKPLYHRAKTQSQSRIIMEKPASGTATAHPPAAPPQRARTVSASAASNSPH